MIRRALLAAVILLAASRQAGYASTPLTLWVDVDGTAYLWNTFDFEVRFSGYALGSTVDGLNPVGWKTIGESLAENPQAVQGVLGAQLVSTSTHARTDEAIFEGSFVARLWPGDKFPIGKPFDSVPPRSTETAFWHPEFITVVLPMDIVYAPEPSTWLLATLAGIELLAFRRRTVKEGDWP